MRIMRSIQNRIYEIRGERVMLDFDLGQLYEVETKAVNQAVKRNNKRFPKDFMFRLTIDEWEEMRSQIVTASNSTHLRPKIITAQKKRNTALTPFAFTEQGVAMLSGVLNSDKAIQMNIAIMRAFVQLRAMIASNKGLARRLNELEKKYDGQFRIVFEAIRELMAEPESKSRRIGFKT